MKIKEKFIGVLLIILGSLPFLLKISVIENFFSKYSFLSFLMPGKIIYQIIIILLGIWLILRIRPKVETNK